MSSTDLHELAGVYAESTGLPVVVCLAFVSNDREPPPRQRVDRVGYTARERAMIAPFLSSPPAIHTED